MFFRFPPSIPSSYALIQTRYVVLIRHLNETEWSIHFDGVSSCVDFRRTGWLHHRVFTAREMIMEVGGLK
jgi:hypothetical protein